MGWHTARTLLPPPPPRSSGAAVRWLMARGRRASGVAAAQGLAPPARRPRAAGAPWEARARAARVQTAGEDLVVVVVVAATSNTSPDRGSQPAVIRSCCHHHPPTTKGLRRPFERARHAHAPPTARRPARRRRETLERRRRRSRAALLPCATVLPLRSSVVEAVAARFERMNTNCNSSLFRVSLFKISQSLSVSLGIRVRLRALHSIPLATFRTQFISLYIQSVQLSSPYCRGLESPKTRVRCPRPPRSI